MAGEVKENNRSVRMRSSESMPSVGACTGVHVLPVSQDLATIEAGRWKTVQLLSPQVYLGVFFGWIGGILDESEVADDHLGMGVGRYPEPRAQCCDRTSDAIIMPQDIQDADASPSEDGSPKACKGPRQLEWINLTCGTRSRRSQPPMLDAACEGL